MYSEMIKIEDKSVLGCEAVNTVDKEKVEIPMISLQIAVPVGYAGTEILLSRKELHCMIDALKKMWQD